MDEYRQIVSGAAIVLGVFIPVLMVIANRTLKDYEKKIDKLFLLCDGIKEELAQKGERIAKLEEAIDRLDRVAERCGK